MAAANKQCGSNMYIHVGLLEMEDKNHLAWLMVSLFLTTLQTNLTFAFTQHIATFKSFFTVPQSIY